MIQENMSLNQSSSECGRWTKEEHNKFVQALSMYGKNWKKVQSFLGTRSAIQIRSHAQKFFNRLEKEYNLKVNKVKSQEIQKIFSSLLEKKKDELNGLNNCQMAGFPSLNLLQSNEKMYQTNTSNYPINEQQMELLRLRQIIDQKLIMSQIKEILSRKNFKIVKADKQRGFDQGYTFKYESEEMLQEENPKKEFKNNEFTYTHP